jgi:hypothetical protein
VLWFCHHLWWLCHYMLWFVITCGDFVILCGEFVIICGVVSLYVVGLSFCVMAYIRCVYLSVSSVSFVILYSRLFSGDSYLVMNGVCFSPHKLLWLLEMLLSEIEQIIVWFPHTSSM